MRRNPEPAQRVGATMAAGFTLLLAALPLQHARAACIVGRRSAFLFHFWCNHDSCDWRTQLRFGDALLFELHFGLV